MRGFAFGLALHEIGVRGEVVERLAFEIGERLEAVFGHEGEQFLTHRLNEFVPELHDAGANLHRVRAQQDELRGIAARLYAADGRERTPGELLANHLRDLHHHAQRNRPDGLR